MKVFYCPEMVADSLSMSPSAAKPKAFVEALLASGESVEILRPVPVLVEQLELAHDSAYVRGVLERKISNGFGNTSEDIARSLPWTSGAMLSAAEAALTDGIACAPVSGFHHARYKQGGGFCTFNGLMVTAQVLRIKHSGLRVAIVDADYHYGDGTDDILQQLGITDVFHYTFGRHFHTSSDAAAYLKAAADIPTHLRDFGADIVLYQAGADAHVHDPLGGVLTTEQLSKRDELIIRGCAGLGIPVAWNLAGGYQRDENGGISKVLEIHLETARVAQKSKKRK